MQFIAYHITWNGFILELSTASTAQVLQFITRMDKNHRLYKHLKTDLRYTYYYNYNYDTHINAAQLNSAACSH